MCVLDRAADAAAEVSDLIHYRILCRGRDTYIERASASGERDVGGDRGREQSPRGLRALEGVLLSEDQDCARAPERERTGALELASAEARDLEPVIVEALGREGEREGALRREREVQDRRAVGAREAHDKGPSREVPGLERVLGDVAAEDEGLGAGLRSCCERE